MIDFIIAHPVLAQLVKGGWIEAGLGLLLVLIICWPGKRGGR